jgi:hypothetical protein
MMCFARGEKECAVLKVGMSECKKEQCSFYKTDAQLQSERKKSLDRIKSLDKTVQLDIKTKYGLKSL